MPISNGPHPASPSVFVSSTVREFRDLRSAIAYTLRRQGFTVYLSEAADFDVRGDRSAIEECFENIRNCDYYILLIGSMRGNLFEEETSITRQEYRVARDGFLSSGRPRFFLYLREATLTALQSNQEAQRAAGIDDPVHLASFIDEVEQPQIEGTPNYLTRFRDFEDVIHSMESRLNLGRDLLERLTRHSLVLELVSNLTLMVTRAGTSAFPPHWYMSGVREGLSIVPRDLDQNIVLPDDHVVPLALALTGMTRGQPLHTNAIEESLERGVFLTFNPASGALEESPIHKALRQTLADIQALRQRDASTTSPQWDLEILTAISTRWRGHPYSLEIKGWHLTFALSYYDQITNIFNGHLELYKVLVGMNEELQPYERQPVTPLGELEEQRIRAESVSVEEIALLIQREIWPFGTRIPREKYGKTREEQINKIADNLHASLTKAGIDTKLYPPDILKNVAEKFLDDHTVLPEEGIEDLRSK